MPARLTPDDAANASALPAASEPAETWAHRYLTAPTLADKLRRPPRSLTFAPPANNSLRVAAPSRPEPLRVRGDSPKSLRPGALRDPARRAQIFHTFWHHELQAAELMAWALLAFPETPTAFRRGLVRVAADEIRHMALYADLLAGLGFAPGDFAVRDWFWERVPACTTPSAFVAVMGLGFEAGNLDHAARFASALRAAGDEKSARVHDEIGRDEIGHVRFAARWFAVWNGALTFASWSAHLPPPLSPLVMRGAPINARDRARAGMNDDFVGELSAWQPRPRGC